jgi:hypothetical protein
MTAIVTQFTTRDHLRDDVVSGQSDYTLASAQAVGHSALQLLGKIGEGVAMSAAQKGDTYRFLNYLLLNWQGRHFSTLWAEEPILVFTQKDVQRYELVEDATPQAAWCWEYLQDFNSTHIRVAASATDTTIECDDTTGMAASDYVGIETTSNNMEWFKVDSVTDSDTFVIAQLAATGSFTGSSLAAAAAVDNQIYWYTPSTTGIVPPPRRMKSAHVRLGYQSGNNLPDTDVPVGWMSQSDYRDLSNKAAPGQINQYYYNHQTPVDSGSTINTRADLFLWPITQDETHIFRAWGQRPTALVENGTTDPSALGLELPGEWLLPLVYGLAVAMGPMYGVIGEHLQTLAALSAGFLEDAEKADTELVIRLVPNQNWNDE